MKEQKHQPSSHHHHKQNVQNNIRYIPIQTFNPFEWIKNVLHGLKKLSVALQYQFSQLTSGFFDDVKLPWFKIGLVVLAMFILLKKDLRFQFNMKAPGHEMVEGNQQEGAVRTANYEEFGIAQNTVWKSNSPEKKYLTAHTLDEKKVKAYIDRFTDVAQSEMKKFGIPASIKMACAILESQANTHTQTIQNNNHFGSHLAGKKYDSAWQNWRSHSIFIAKSPFKDLLNHGNHYKNWADGLQKSGYSTDPNYSKKILQIIHQYDLFDLDR